MEAENEMSICKFKFWSRSPTRGGTSCCGACGCDTQAQVESILWIYQGHSGDVDLFKASRLIYCLGCGEPINGYSERCHGEGGLRVDVEIMKNEEIERYESNTK
jgi:hypothetical protein